MLFKLRGRTRDSAPDLPVYRRLMVPGLSVLQRLEYVCVVFVFPHCFL